MADNSGRGYLPPTVPNPSNPHRRQWTVGPQAPSFYPAPQSWPGSHGHGSVGHGHGPVGHGHGPSSHGHGPISHGHGTKPYLMHGGSSSPQSEGIDLTARPAGPPEPAHNGGDPINGQVKEVAAGVSMRPMEGAKPLEPLVAPSIPAVIPVAQRQFMNPSLPQHEPSLPPVSVAPSLIEEPIPAPPAPAPLPSPPQPITSQVRLEVKSLSAVQKPSPSQFPDPNQPPSEHGLPPPSKVSASSAPPVADHVESLLENMFQGGDESPVKQSVIVTNNKAPALTEDKVVAILEDKSPIETLDVKPEIKTEPDKGNKFQEVESELEKMFAGIVEEVDDVKPTITTSESQAPGSVEESVPTPEAPAKKKRSAGKPRPKKFNDSDQPVVPAKRGRKRVGADMKKGGKKQRQEKIKEASNDSSSNLGGLIPKKGPYIYIEGAKETPTRICVVNSGSRDEEEKDRGMDKGVARRKHQYVEGRLKGSGLYSSTLSSKYNAQNADLTWVCIFCKLRSNCEKGLGGEPAGDLFGPYILTIPKEPEMDPREPKDSDVVAEQKRRGGGKQASLRATGGIEQFVKDVSKKSKKQLPVGEDISGEREIWVHEKCAVWAPGVFLVGPHLIGLAEAVAAASVTKCSYCSHFGASLGCVVRNCPVRCHYGCAVATRWDLNYETFIAKCPNHTRQWKS